MLKKLMVVWVLCIIMGNTYTQTFNLVNRYGMANLIFENAKAYNGQYYFTGLGNDSITPLVKRKVLTKTNNQGNVVYNKIVQADSIDSYYSTRNGLIFKEQNIYLFGSAANTKVNFRPLIVKFDTIGNQLQTKRLEDSTVNSRTVLGVTATHDGGFILIGRRVDFNNQGDAYWLKLDSNLNQEWIKSFGQVPAVETPSYIMPISNNRYLIGGARTNVPFNYTTTQTFLIIIDNLGNVLKQFIDPNTKSGPANDIAYLPDSSGFVYCGSNIDVVNSSNIFNNKTITCIDTILKAIKWLGKVPENRSHGEYLDLEITNKIIAIGYERGQPIDFSPPYPIMGTIGAFDFQGNPLMYKYYEGVSSSLNKESESYLYCMDLLPNGEILAAGRTENDGPIEGWIIKLDSNGCINDSCPQKGGITDTKIKLISYYGLKNYFSQEAYFSLGFNLTYPQLYLTTDTNIKDSIIFNIGYDISGVWQPFSSTRTDTFNIDSLPPGTYTLAVNTLLKDTTADFPFTDSLFSTKYLSFSVVGVNEITELGKLSAAEVYPNPFNSTVQIQSNATILQVKLYNQLGQLVFKQERPTNVINLNHLLEGMYFLKIKTTQGEIVKKVVKY